MHLPPSASSAARLTFGLSAAVLAAMLAAGHPAFASSDEAWKEFSAAVEQKCLAATAQVIENPVAVVDPFGSESFGLALVTGTVPKGSDPVSVICVLDKQSGVVEIGSELSKAALSVTVPAK